MRGLVVVALLQRQRGMREVAALLFDRVRTLSKSRSRRIGVQYRVRRTVVPVLATAVLILAIPQAEARNAANHGVIVARHVGGATIGRFVIVSTPNIKGRVVVFDRFQGRLVALDRRGRFGFGPPTGAFGALGVVDGESPAVVSVPSPSVAANAPQSTPPISAADLPPCREMAPSGVVIERGMACSHTSR